MFGGKMLHADGTNFKSYRIIAGPGRVGAGGGGKGGSCPQGT